ncbi:ABC transporter permease subunit [Photobacterium nomapromontoriensis]|uniref:ABC transporter permease subunit n=1 Tax=Photobacterium nomapromontoriensis TaxID=2910237 RepID=UPI003D0FECEC
MAKAGAFLMGESPGRKVKDKLTRYGVTAGGIFVLITLVLIFFYLLYVIIPIFSSVKVTPIQTFTTSFSDKTVSASLSDHNDYLFRLSDRATLSVLPLTGPKAGQVISQYSLLDGATSLARTLPAEGIFAVGGEHGEVAIVKPVFNAVNSTAEQPVSLIYPLGQAAIQLDPEHQPITALAVSVRSERAGIIGVTADGRVRAMVFTSQDGPLDMDQPQWHSSSFAIKGLPTEIKALAVTPDTRTAYVLAGMRIYVVSLDGHAGVIREVVEVSRSDSQPVQLELLSGANSLLISHSDHSVSQWFDVLRDGKRKLTLTREFELPDNAVVRVVPEYARKGFFALQQDGQLSAFYTTIKGAIYSEPVFSGALPDLLAISPRANRLMAATGNDWQLFQVDNSHPEIGIASLWQKIWYEGYPEPAYVWQSTSASDEFEPKLSLVPIVFGTLKAAVYALFFAIPMALAGAIYTAYFMSSRMRQVVKPTIELMEALPTVILGFLAGIWLAPIIEAHLIGIMLLLVMLPAAMITVGALWSLVTWRWRQRIPSGLHVLLLMPVIIGVTYACFAISPWIETAFFAGDVRVYLTNEWGLGYDQRNTLVVGIAMGFAVIPTIFSIAEDAIFSVPSHLTNGSLALGATQWQTLTKVVLLTASPGIFSAVMMGLGRAVGETMIVLMATGNTPIMDWNVLEGMRTLAATIAIEMPESEVGSSHYRIMFLAAFVLFVFTFFFNTIAELVRQRLREKYSSL